MFWIDQKKKIRITIARKVTFSFLDAIHKFLSQALEKVKVMQNVT